MYAGLHVKCQSLLSCFSETGIFLACFFKSPQISNFIKIRQLGDEFILTDRGTD